MPKTGASLSGYFRRSPHGERGLKFGEEQVGVLRCLSLPSRGAWIEIGGVPERWWRSAGSLPSRGAWIEIPSRPALSPTSGVAPLTGSVD